MSICINKNSVEYQTLQQKSGIPESILSAVCRNHMEKYGRFPHLDELPNSNSEPYLKDLIKVKKNGSAKISTMLEITGKNNIDEAVIELNNRYRDLEIQTLPIINDAIVDIAHRPTTNNFEEVEKVEPDDKINNQILFETALNKLASLYGIKFNEITDAELNLDKWNTLIPDVHSVNAFIFNGEIYINVDRAKADAPIHEMFHILVGSMRFENPTLYQSLISFAEKLPNYNALLDRFPGRTKNDANEEIFITELAKYFAGMPSLVMNLDEKTMYELKYNITRTLDSILMGSDSVKTISEDRLYNMTLKEVIKEVNSSVATNKFKPFINIEGSELHRKLNNIKSDLLKNNTLEEYCD